MSVTNEKQLSLNERKEKLAAAKADALQTLHEIVKDKKVPPNVRVQAADLILASLNAGDL